MAEEDVKCVMDGKDVIKAGNYVIIRRTHDKESCRLIKAEIDKPVYLGKQRIHLNNIFGHRFGTTYAVNKDRNLDVVNIHETVDQSLELPQMSAQLEANSKDNRFILDDGKSQKLSRDDIESLKSSLTSNEVIENLVKNCTTFDQKTPFAQQKYLKKKQKKYSNLVTILRPNVRLLTEMYFSRGPQKIDFLRIDSLSQMLSLCNVMSGGKYIVLDTNLGILTAAVVERLGSDGNVIQVYTDVGPVSTYRQAVDALNLPNETINQILFGLQINEIYRLSQNDSRLEMSDQNNDQQMDESDTKQTDSEKANRRALRHKEAMKALEILKDRDMDGLLYLSKCYEPLDIIMLLIDFLADSRPFAIFSPYMEPLSRCFNELKKKAVFLRLTETWLRKYQVLKDRTRPDMTMSPSSGPESDSPEELQN
ncbi:unnamed protein product [Medioppia subpectinata]|uniref:tRNA (adenine(58)-N(1))-methyltransferase non-catalytic subunit TRM6 n=1 Tax=Medioppia subpectinata TaxID=1979941 RepID=A0A7R9PWB7_9ACAR|nr:unnamed protein product [Medioppia subpectinata]CAG2103766.1 unnamed protein product [Medioppia subpectinata]